MPLLRLFFWYWHYLRFHCFCHTDKNSKCRKLGWGLYNIFSYGSWYPAIYNCTIDEDREKANSCYSFNTVLVFVYILDNLYFPIVYWANWICSVIIKEIWFCVTSFKRNNLILMIYMKKSNWFSRSIEQHNRCFTTIKVLQSADDYHKPSFFKLIISYNRLGFYFFFNFLYIGELYFKHLIFTVGISYLALQSTFWSHHYKIQINCKDIETPTNSPKKIYKLLLKIL